MMYVRSPRSLNPSHYVLSPACRAQDGPGVLLSGARALLWGVMPTLTAFMLTRMALLLMLGQTPRKRRRLMLRYQMLKKELRKQADKEAGGGEGNHPHRDTELAKRRVKHVYQF
jgi:hypothetical protein